MPDRDVIPTSRAPVRGNPLSASVKVLGLFVRGTAIVFACQLLLYAVGFAVARIPAWPFMALLCALFGLIPQIGSLIGFAIVFFVGWVTDVDWTHLAIAGGAWVAVQAIEGFWLTPKLLGRPLGLRPMVVFLSLIAASIFFGPLGLLLAIPVLAVAMVWVRFFRGSNPLP